MRGQIKCKGKIKDSGGRGGGEMTSTNAKDENEMFQGEIRGADSAEGRYEKHEGKSEGEK